MTKLEPTPENQSKLAAFYGELWAWSPLIRAHLFDSIQAAPADIPIEKPCLIYSGVLVLISAVSRSICPAPEWTSSLNAQMTGYIDPKWNGSMNSSIPSGTFRLKALVQISNPKWLDWRVLLSKNTLVPRLPDSSQPGNNSSFSLWIHRSLKPKTCQGIIITDEAGEVVQEFRALVALPADPVGL